MGEPADKWSMPGKDCKRQGDSVQVGEGPAVAEEEVGVEGSGPVERGAGRVKQLTLGQLFLETTGWRGRRRSGGTILTFRPHKVGGLEVLNGELGGVERGSVEVFIGGGWSGVVMEKAGAGGSGRGLVMGVESSIVVKHAREEVSKGHVGFVGEGGCKVFVAYSFDAGDERKVGNDGGGEVVAEGADILDEAVLRRLAHWRKEWRGPPEARRLLTSAIHHLESIVVKHAREEVSKGHVGFVGEGGCKVFVAYSFEAGDERKVGNDGGGEVVAEGADILDEAVRGTGLAEVAELFKVVINGFLGAKGGSEKVGPLEEGVTWSSGGSAVADFNHPPFGGIAEEVGGGNGEPVGKGHVVEGKRVLEMGGGGNETEVEVEGLVDVVDVVNVVVGVEVGSGVLLEAAVEEGVVCAVEEGGAAVVTTVMEGLSPSSMVTQSDMDDMVAFMSSREAVTEVWKVLSAWRMVERSGVAVFAGGCSPARLRVMLSTESVRMSDMLMEDAVMSGEEGVEDAAGTDVEDAAAAVEAAAAAARWEFVVWRGGMWRWGGQFPFTRIEHKLI
ncbi:hypothetical protein CBR_g18568 [Chara braunii]|uniref:Uncharacterized protein n=1 Tax=Chara braunii TaxID=69332 RepID=A0A388JT54_CHABU|nr:hypothetical protein CBR_g18568 [Chara braunii]|eukprot:GBG60970.1 hypothetical protein CBR_g18568 [Chara braunii]